MTILDEAMGFAVMALVPSQGTENLPLTAGCSVKFLKPVDCPGSVGVKVKIIENGTKKTKVEATMIDSNEREVAIAESVWIRPGGSIGKL